MDTRTKHTIAQDRWIVAEQRLLEAERRKSLSNLQLLDFEQKQLEKKLATLQSQLGYSRIDRSLKKRGRSTSEVRSPRTRRSSSWTDTLLPQQKNLSVSLNNSHHHLLTLPKIDVGNKRRFSTYSDGDVSETGFFISDMDSGGEDGENEPTFSKQLNLPPAPSTINFSQRWSVTEQHLSRLNDEHCKLLPPLVAIIPPDDDFLFVYQ